MLADNEFMLGNVPFHGKQQMKQIDQQYKMDGCQAKMGQSILVRGIKNRSDAKIMDQLIHFS